MRRVPPGRFFRMVVGNLPDLWVSPWPKSWNRLGQYQHNLQAMWFLVHAHANPEWMLWMTLYWVIAPFRPSTLWKGGGWALCISLISSSFSWWDIWSNWFFLGGKKQYRVTITPGKPIRMVQGEIETLSVWTLLKKCRYWKKLGVGGNGEIRRV